MPQSTWDQVHVSEGSYMTYTVIESAKRLLPDPPCFFETRGSLRQTIIKQVDADVKPFTPRFEETRGIRRSRRSRTEVSPRVSSKRGG
jgi:hypothetical protein